MTLGDERYFAIIWLRDPFMRFLAMQRLFQWFLWYDEKYSLSILGLFLGGENAEISF